MSLGEDEIAFWEAYYRIMLPMEESSIRKDEGVSTNPYHSSPRFKPYFPPRVDKSSLRIIG